MNKNTEVNRNIHSSHYGIRQQLGNQLWNNDKLKSAVCTDKETLIIEE